MSKRAYRNFVLSFLVATIATVLGLAGCKAEETKDQKQIEFEKKFRSEAALVKTCPGDPRYASGPTSNTQRVYRFQKELWVEEVNGYRRVEGTPQTVCDALLPEKPK